MSLRNTSARAPFNYTTHVHSEFNREHATEITAKATLAAVLAGGGGGSIDIATLAKETTLVACKNALQGELAVNVVDISGLALQTTQADLLLLAELQDLNGVKINPDHPYQTSYDFNNNHVAMTMLGPTSQDIRWTIDTLNNRDGWKFSTNNGQVLGSNCYWYANGAGTGNQTVLQYQDFSSWYCVVKMDNTDDVDNAAFIGAYSPPTGTNDVIPTFAHSRWVFSLPGDTQLFQNEKVLLYYGAIHKVHSDLRHLPLSLVTIGNNGDRAPTETVYLITTNTASGLAVGAVNYMLHEAGFIALDIAREYHFSNSLERRQLANLSATNIPVAVSNFPLPLSSVGVNNFPTTQAVSIAAVVDVSGSFWQATQPVSVANALEVIGTFYQATQPVSIADSLTISNTSFDIGNLPATQPVSLADTVAVSGTFYQVTQPVSVADTVSVSGTFYQATQPVSIADALAVTGTFYQATQPVSITDAVTVSGTVAFSNTVIDTHIYANSSGNNMHKVHSDNQGYLLVGISDAAENRVTTSTVNGSQCLDVRVLNGTATTPLAVSTRDGSGIALTSTLNSTKQSLDVNISNLSTNQVQTRALTSSDVVSANVKSGSGTAITSTVVSTKTGLDVNVCNSVAVPVSGTFYPTTQPVSLTYSSTTPLYCTPGVDVGSNVNTGWSNSSLTNVSVSTAIDIQWAKTVSVLCRAGGAGTLVIQVSVDNSNWYTTSTTITLSGTADTVVNYNDLGARYVRLKSNSTVTGVSATIAAK